MTKPDRSIELFFRDEYRPIVRVVAAIVGDLADAEAIAQDAFVQAIVRWRRIRNYDKPGAWVRRVAIRESVRFARKRNLTSDTLPEMIEEHHIAADIDFRRSLADLPTNQRIAVALFYVGGVEHRRNRGCSGLCPGHSTGSPS